MGRKTAITILWAASLLFMALLFTSIVVPLVGGLAFAVMAELVGIAALVKSVWERRGPNRWPIGILVRERFRTPTWRWGLIGLGAGSLSVIGPLVLATLFGWAQIQPNANFLSVLSLWGLFTFGIKLVWAAIEELVVRGAILPQTAKFMNGSLALALSALLFAWAHLERSGALTPTWLDLIIFGLDGVGFALAYLVTRSLWPPTIWHAAKNISIWLLFSESTLQFAPGLFQARYTGPVIWVGSSQQSGFFDVMVTLLIVSSLLYAYRSELAHGLEWIKSQ